MAFSLFDIGTWLVECGIECTLFLAFMLMLCRLILSGASAGDRHFVILIGFVGCLLIPVVSAPPVAPWFAHTLVAGDNVPVWLRLLPTVWLAGVVLLVTRHAFNAIRVEVKNRQLVREETEHEWSTESYQRLAARHGIRRPPRLRIDHQGSSASIQGVITPVITVGQEFNDLPPNQQEQILLHEFEHYRRRDLQSTIATRLVVALYWPVPFAWWLADRLALDNERACDDAVIAAGHKPRDYAETLIAAYERQPSSGARGLMALAVAPSRRVAAGARPNWWCRRLPHDKTLHLRLVSIISLKSQRTSSPSCRIATAAVVFLTALSCSKADLFAHAIVSPEPLTVCQVVQTTSDDAEENVATGDVMVASRDLDFSYDKQQEMHPLVGLRFSDLDIPRGARILSARVVFVGDEIPIGEPELSIFCQRDPRARTFLKRPFDISRRFRGDEASVAWSPGQDWIDLTRTDDSTTPELSSIVQELVNHPAWDRDGVIVFGITSRSSNPFSYREAAAFDHELGPEAAPRLEITYRRY